MNQKEFEDSFRESLKAQLNPNNFRHMVIGLPDSAFTAGGIRIPFHIDQRALLYWQKCRYVIADISDTHPRVFSRAEAMIAGLIKFFVDNKYTLKDSANFARGIVATLQSQTNNFREIKDGLKVKIIDGCLEWNNTNQEQFKISTVINLTAVFTDLVQKLDAKK